MIDNIYKKSLIILLSFLIAIGPFSDILLNYNFPKARAEEDISIDEEEGDINIPLLLIKDQGQFAVESTNKELDSETCKKTNAQNSNYQEIVTVLSQYYDKNSFINITDLTSGKDDAKLVLSKKDQKSIKSLYYLTKIMPIYREDFEALYRDLPTAGQFNSNKVYLAYKDYPNKSTVDEAINIELKKAKPLYSNYLEYFTFLKNGYEEQDGVEKANNKEVFNKLVRIAEINFSENGDQLMTLWNNEVANIRAGKEVSVDFSVLLNITGLERNRLVSILTSSDQAQKDYLADLIADVVQSLSIDIRVLNTLIYLVTPKNLGGAGHWRIKVNRIFQSDQMSKESDGTIEKLTGGNSSQSKETVECDENMTAADCGKQRSIEADLEIKDSGGEEYEAWLTDLSKGEDSYIDEMNKIKDQRNISSHAVGQAFDIEEIDDIRCTKVEKKRIGSDKKTKQSIKPIKLAWQTSEGWEKSRGSDQFDQISMLKSLAQDSVLSFLEDINGDTVSYDGDITNANFEDYAKILGQSLFAYMINTPGANIKGYDVKSTLKEIGELYIADYFELPRDMFQNYEIDNLDDFEYLIGRSAIEKRLGLPFGSLDNYNYLESVSQGKAVYDMEGLLMNVGQRKVERELGFKAGDLTDFLKKGTDIEFLVGKRVLENDLSFPKESWPSNPVPFGLLKDYITSGRQYYIKQSSGFIDTELHLERGTTKSFVDGGMDSTQFAKKIGKNRISDTTFGLKYFSAANSAYQLPEGTWEESLKGNKDSILKIGIYTISRLLGEQYVDLEQVDDAGNKFLTDKEHSLKVILPNPDAKITAVKKTQIEAGPLVHTIDVYSTNQSIGKVEYNREMFGHYLFRQWLRSNLTEAAMDGCEAKTSIDSDISNTNGLILQDRVDFSRNQLEKCLLNQKVDFQINYIDSNDVEATKEASKTVSISTDKAKNIGLLDYDLYRMLGYKEADARNVFERVGSKLLYYGIANKTLSKEERAKISLDDIQPTLRVENEELRFYIERALALKDLATKIEEDFELVKSIDDPEVKELIERTKTILATVKDISSGTEIDIQKISNFIRSCRQLVTEIDRIQTDYKRIREIYGLKERKGNAKIREANVLVDDINELSRLVAEIISGKQIQDANTMTLKKIKDMSTNSGDNRDSGDTRRKGAKLSPLQIAGLIFDLLNGDKSFEEVIIILGANTLESELKLPSYSLIYLVRYFSQGVHSAEALYLAIGQARIEEAFNMPPNYFMGINDPQYPDFSYSEGLINLKKWLPKYKDYSDKAFKQIIDDLFLNPQFGGKVVFKGMVEEAKLNFAKENPNFSERDIDDIVKNIGQRKLNNGAFTPEDDLLLKMGLVRGKYDSYKNANSPIWAESQSRIIEIEKDFGIPRSSIKTLFTGENYIDQKSLSNREKNEIEASNLKISKGNIEKYIMALNGELGLDELNTDFNYYVNNPYARVQSAEEGCPVIYTSVDGFKKSNKIESGSFCYYDKTGRHCFENEAEVIRYAKTHEGDKFTGLIAALASNLQAVYGGDDIDFYNSLVNFINDKEDRYAFDDKEKTLAVINQIAKNSKNSDTEIEARVETLTKLFSRETTAMITNFKKKVGKIEAEKILSYEIFSQLSLNIDPSKFDAADFWDILNGDFQAVYRIGMNYIEQDLGLKPGTIELLWAARSENTRKCALNQAGSTILGEFFGLESISIDGILKSGYSLERSIGNAKIEKYLDIPKGSFRGATTEELINNIGAVNFALAFKIPVENIQSIDSYAARILGDRYKNIAKTSRLYKLTQIQNYLFSYKYVSIPDRFATYQLDSDLKAEILSLFEKLKTNQQTIPTGKSDWEIRYREQLGAFYNHIDYLDKMFSLEKFTTLTMLANGSMKPDDYVYKVGQKHMISSGVDKLATKIAEMMGLSPDDSVAFKNSINAIQSIIYHRDPSLCNNVYYREHHKEECSAYKNWGILYANLDKLFEFKLDERLSLPLGSIQNIIEHANNPLPTMMMIGAKKLDQQLNLNSTSYTSFTKLYEMVFAKETISINTQCYNEVFGANGMIENDLNAKLAIAQKNNDQATISSINQQLKDRYDQVRSCEITKHEQLADNKDRGDGNVPVTIRDKAEFWLQNVIAEQITNQIIKVTAKDKDGNNVYVGPANPNDPIAVAEVQRDLTKFVGGFFDGRGADMRYLTVILSSMTANYAMVLIDGINLKSDDCHDKVDDSTCKVAIPKSMYISYGDIKMAVFGDQKSSQAMAEIAAYNFWNDPEANFPGLVSINNDYALPVNPEILATHYGNVCPGSEDGGSVVANTTGCLTQQEFYTGQALPRDREALSTANIQEMYAQAGYDPAAAADSGFNYKTFIEQQTAQCNANGGAACDRLEQIEMAKKQYEKQSAKVYQEVLTYRMFDAAFYKLDQNIYPGFLYDIIKGNPQQKGYAIATYVKNGIQNGNLLGIKFDGLPIDEIAQWVNVINFAKDYFSGDQATKEGAFGKFVGNNGLNFIAGFISKNSEKWFGFEIPSDMIVGAFVGLFTGKWGTEGCSDLFCMLENKSTVSVGGQNLPTLMNSISGWGLPKLFSWADKQLGLDAGTTYEYYQKAKIIYKYYKNKKDLQTEIDFWELIISFITDLLVEAIMRSWGDEISVLEEKLGLVPGSTFILIEAAATWAVTYAVTSIAVSAGAMSTAAASNLMSAAIGGLWVALAIFIIVNLFSVYKVEYWCTNDGYYPKIGRPDYNKDISGMPWWGGNVKNSGLSKIMQQNSIESAQYKAQRLIGDVLEIQNNKDFNDLNGDPTVPVQIMTGRDEDVKFWANTVQTNMCQFYFGEGSIVGYDNKDGFGRAICNLNTRAGLWQNAQTVAWTHIGF